MRLLDKLVITIDDKSVAMPIEQAHQLYKELGELFGHSTHSTPSTPITPQGSSTPQGSQDEFNVIFGGNNEKKASKRDSKRDSNTR